ncbi:MAG: hypothetical protein KDJ44_15355 [Rhodoblastus sp.]|nr:hypothetical protein [Rhodoblastus sp.]
MGADHEHALIHYVEHGAAESRDPHPLFSTQWYVQQTPDLAQSGENPLAHYLARQPSWGPRRSIGQT